MQVQFSYRLSRADVGNLKNLLKCFLKRFADYGGLWKYKICVRTGSIFIDVKNLSVIPINRIISFISSIIQSLKAYDPFKTILQSKPAKDSTCMSLVSIGKDLSMNKKGLLITSRYLMQSTKYFSQMQ